VADSSLRISHNEDLLGSNVGSVVSFVMFVLVGGVLRVSTFILSISIAASTWNLGSIIVAKMYTVLILHT